MVFTLGKNIIDIDIERTKAFYSSAKIVTDGCTCIGCRNYVKAVDYFPQKVKELFTELRVDLKKAAELCTYCAENDGKSILYGGFYHLCGKLMSDTNVWIQVSGNKKDTQVYRQDADLMYKIDEDYAIGFSRDCSLLEENFPMPAIQMEIEFHAPWVLNEKNTYV